MNKVNISNGVFRPSTNATEAHNNFPGFHFYRNKDQCFPAVHSFVSFANEAAAATASDLFRVALSPPFIPDPR